jgi:pimeloyl-ACP methyl ester carboxylesterase
VFADLAGRLAATSRTCWYDRAGFGSSPPQAAEWPDPSPASQAGDLGAALGQQGIVGPYVVLGWSYGGMVAQTFATQRRDDVVGLVLEDTSVREQFTEPLLMDVDEEVGVHWAEGGRNIDLAELKGQLYDLNFRGVPLVVLSQDARGTWGGAWLGFHDDLAARSREAVHVVGVGSGHVMHEDVPDLVVAAVEAVLVTARGTGDLGDCDTRFTDAGGRCRVVSRP